MGGSFKIGRAAGIDVKVHWTFFLLLAFFAYLGYSGSGSLVNGLITALIILALFFCVLLHEYGHSIVAQRLGIEIQDITLLPIGGLARMKSLPEKPWDEVKIAIAGPLVNVVLAPIFFAVAFLLGADLLAAPANVLQGGESLGAIFAYLGFINVALVVFNMIPAFPMDGGRVLRAILAKRKGMVAGTRIAARIGQGFAILLGLLGLTGSPILVLIAGFIFLGAQAEASAVETRAAGQGMTAASMMITDLRLLPVYATLQDAVQLLLSGEQREFPVVDNDRRLEGLLTRDHLIRGLTERGTGATVAQVMAAPVRAVTGDVPFDRALDQLRESGLPALPVVDGHGAVIGLITTDNIADLLLIRRHLAARP